MSSPFCLIDADPIKYKCAFSIEKRNKETETIVIEEVRHAYYNINSMIKRCINRCETDQFQCFVTGLGDRSNFRFDILPDYKANRAKIRKPHYINEVHEFLLKRWKAINVVGEEADDTLSIAHCKLNPFGFNYDTINSVICSIDKDFNNVPGWHYNPGRDEFYFVTEIEALRNFYLQILTGDVSDNIPRIKKNWQKAKVEKKIEKALTEKELYDIVIEEVYNVFYPEGSEPFGKVSDIKDCQDFVLRNGRLVWLRRKDNELWTPNFSEVTNEQQ